MMSFLGSSLLSSPEVDLNGASSGKPVLPRIHFPMSLFVGVTHADLCMGWVIYVALKVSAGGIR